MGVSPRTILTNNDFDSKIKQYTIEAEKFFDAYLNSHYGDLVNDGCVIISAKPFVSKVLSAKKFPSMVRRTLIPIIRVLYPDWQVNWNSNDGDGYFTFSPSNLHLFAPDNSQEKEPVAPTPVDIEESSIESRSELLDLG